MKKILLTGALQYTKEQIEKIAGLGFEVDFVQQERDEVQNPEKYDAVVCNGLFLYNPIERFVNLKHIQLTSAGYDRVDMEYVAEKGIEIFNARGVYSAPIAEWAVLKILEIYKNSRFFYNNEASHSWEKDRNIRELCGKKALIVGCGSIGSEIAKRLHGFDVTVIGADIYEVASPHFDNFVDMENSDKVLAEADIVILTLPLTAETRHMMNKERLASIKAGGVLVNISRGAIIDEQALINELKKNRMCAALDVFEEEPLKQESELWGLKNCIITPHNSFVGEGNNERMFDVICENLMR